MKNKYILPMISILCMISLCLMVMVLATHNKDKGSSEFTPPAFDSRSERGIPTVPKELGYTPVEVEAGYKAYVCGELNEVDGKVDVYFTSVEDNTVWMKLKLIDVNGNTLGETGVIKPGEYVKTLNIDTIPKSTENVKLKIVAYTPDTWYSAGTVALNTILKID